jgi:hypothetical protein
MALRVHEAKELEWIVSLFDDLPSLHVVAVKITLASVAPKPDPGLRAMSVDVSHQSHLYTFLLRILLIDADLYTIINTSFRLNTCLAVSRDVQHQPTVRCPARLVVYVFGHSG